MHQRIIFFEQVVRTIGGEVVCFKPAEKNLTAS
jgi:hypothetical protein